MKLRRTLKYHSLKRGRVRQTWNKHNLFNLSKVERTIPNFIWRTFFQQKWTAKALTRAYHGEHIKERKWERMFSRRMLSVVNMDPVYMAHNDGSEQAAGRGSGKVKPGFEDVTPWHERGQVAKKQKPGMPFEPDLDLVEVDVNGRVTREEANVQQFTGQTPYMSMAYAPLERRIDVAIFRALFASSTRQARQFVIHGAVKVNGQVMRHPSYLLNPGDMFQVNPESVLFATGKKKPTPGSAGDKSGQSGEDGEGAEGEEAEAEEAAAEEESSKSDEAEAKLPEAAEGDAPKGDISRELKFLAKAAKGILAQQKGDLKVKQKQRFRNFIKMSRDALSRAGRPGGEEAVASEKTIVDQVNTMLRELVISDPKVAEKAEESGVFTAEEVNKATEPAESAEKKEVQVEKESREYVMSDREVAQMNKLLKEWEDNPEDPSKPYLTPWEPRRFMGAFAYIPRYLEVNQNICAAVYLRHPVARQKYAEVPTPFPPHVMQLAFNWYLRRR
ncbi:37S ribosomal protein NAM9, mitochondrial [Cytospora mali]|uniref:37S ribosomal protein NAM9, mitochondrial n=1 Tax=Cytospora mali TaxID=578113 RepID=A0A194UT82_CYTMA|nr:37S ribosomal protein NAM9, mitochondrial [Valsa mali var. pyri (nom. inval.)]